MALNIESEYEFDGPREKVYDFLLDPEVLAQSLPGVEKLEKKGEDSFEGDMKLKIGPFSGTFSGEVEIRDKNRPEGYSLDLKGKSGATHVKGTGKVNLEEKEGKTVMSYNLEVKVGGALARIGSRLISSVAKNMAQKSLDSLSEVLQKKLDDEK